MIKIPGYQTIELLDRNDEIELYRLLRLVDGRGFIAKTTCEEYPEAVKVDAFRHEYEILKRLSGCEIIEPHSFDIVGMRPILLMQDIGGCTLHQLLHTHSNEFDFTARLSIAVAVTECLMQLHSNEILLNEITPHQMMVNPATLDIRFIDLRMSSSGKLNSPIHKVIERPDFTLLYISPEQTGRTGITPDYRSDFYSLGVILYEWFSGCLPFELQDVLDIMHRHLAIRPEPLHLRFPIIPQAISDIIDKCLEKIPDDRYASAFGIKSDLEECFTQLKLSGQVGAITLAKHDITEYLVLSSQFYGRRMEQQTLLEALGYASKGMTQTVWVSGNGGIGKTTLINHTLQHVISSDGYYATGKFAIQPIPIPYEAWIQILNQLISQLLMESKLQLEVWKLRIYEALDPYGQLLIDLVPKLELLIGQQPSVKLLPPAEAQHRLYLLLTRFMQLFLREEQPLVLFIDDLQWADEASLQYLAYLLKDNHTSNLLIVLAYRNEEITDQHLLRRLESQFEEYGLTSSYIRLQGLEMTDLKNLLHDAMRYEADEDKELAEAILLKTDGNPFFMKQFLQDLIKTKQLIFEQSSRNWSWDIERIAEMDIAGDATNYVTDKMKLLPYQAGYVLGKAAFLGGSFDLTTLVFITGNTLQELTEVIDVAVRERLIQEVSKHQYRFMHDRIEQAAYALIPQDERSDLHLQIGTLLAERLKADGNATIFEVVNHLNQATDQNQLAEQRRDLAELNLQAALKLKQLTAYETSLRYLRKATMLLEDNSWEQDYIFTFQVYLERAEAEYLCAHYVEAKALFQLLQSKAISNMDKAHVYDDDPIRVEPR
ncbi:ATP-binding protein [Paenibacillus albiflavus]|uniref:ATP-binding protein n=1 Tax=Paenibacillus albiflavus TaxID=2545760 RepID=UPI001F376CC4|nr:AAA family ATPase [Paenibacillus albiflavus]